MDGMNMYENYDQMAGQNGPADRKEEIKAARKHFSKLGGMFVLGTIIIYAVQLLAVTLVDVLKPEWLYNGNISLMVQTMPMYIVGMPLLILLVVKIVPAQQVERRPMKAGHFIVAVIMCYAIMYVSNFAGLILTTVIGALKGGAVQNEILNVTESVSLWAIVLYMVICAPIMEEFIFRKLIVDRTVRYGQGVAVLLSGLMFGLFHGNLNQFIYAFALGVFFAFIYVKTGNIKITIALHMLINFVGGGVSSALMRALDLDAYMEAALSGDMGTMMAFVQENLAAMMAYMIFLVFVFGMMIAGSVILIVCLVKKKFTFEKGQVVIPKGKRFSTVAGNIGMVIYGLFWVVMIILQLFM